MTEMTLEAGIHKFGPDNATLAIRTKRGGAAAKAGHDLLIHVTSWQATLQVGAEAAESTLALDADGSSLRASGRASRRPPLGQCPYRTRNRYHSWASRFRSAVRQDTCGAENLFLL